MEFACQLSQKQVPLFPTRRSFPTPRSSKVNTISCRSTTTMDAQRVGSTNYYKILSLESEKVGFDEIKKAYRNLARQYHPDVVDPSTKEESTKMFVEVQKAYETLSNPNSRQKYDFELGYLSRCGGSGQGGRSDFDKDVWADQLSGLEFKSNQKRHRKQQRTAACV